jgi:hypothetical protein
MLILTSGGFEAAIWKFVELYTEFLWVSVNSNTKFTNRYRVFGDRIFSYMVMTENGNREER